MPEPPEPNTEALLTLRSQLAELTLVWPWVDALAAEHAIPEQTRFAIDLCLEEALSNIIRHGYAGEPNHAITVRFTAQGKNGLTFIIADNAPPFAPPEPTERRKAPTLIEQIKPGGKGIDLLRKFAGTLDYEQLADGNRLTISFPLGSC